LRGQHAWPPRASLGLVFVARPPEARRPAAPRSMQEN
jgi:hypothetical protein